MRHFSVSVLDNKLIILSVMESSIVFGFLVETKEGYN